MKNAIVFDLDGTLVSTEEFHFESFKQVFSEYGIEYTFELHTSEYTGTGNRHIFQTEFEKHGIKPDKEEIERRKAHVKDTLRCPHCEEPLKKWAVPQTLFTQWPNEFMYICFNDECSYFIRGWDALAKMGNRGSYRLMYDPETDCCQPIPVPTSRALRSGIID